MEGTEAAREAWRSLFVKLQGELESRAGPAGPESSGRLEQSLEESLRLFSPFGALIRFSGLLRIETASRIATMAVALGLDSSAALERAVATQWLIDEQL